MNNTFNNSTDLDDIQHVFDASQHVGEDILEKNTAGQGFGKEAAEEHAAGVNKYLKYLSSLTPIEQRRLESAGICPVTFNKKKKEWTRSAQQQQQQQEDTVQQPTATASGNEASKSQVGPIRAELYRLLPVSPPEKKEQMRPTVIYCTTVNINY